MEQDNGKHILAFAYACAPDEGGEPGAGWVWTRMLGQWADVTIFTRENNRDAIVAALPTTPEADRLHFEYVDLPRQMRFWKRGPRGARLYYVFWQIAALRRARRLADASPPDIVWHLTWANAWLGSLAALLGYPFVYGPVGGGVGTPWRLAPALGWRGFSSELARTSARTVARYLNPLARVSWQRAQVILVQNPETREWLPRRHREKVVLFSNVVLDEHPDAQRSRTRSARPTMLYVGRLLPWKGVSLAIRTLVPLAGWELTICGGGPDLKRLRKLARRLGVADRVRFLGRLPRTDARRLMRESADALIFPSLHDEGGFVVAEALAAGLPVVCLDRGGPPVLGGAPVAVFSMSSTISALGRAVLDTIESTPPRYPSMGQHSERVGRLLRHMQMKQEVRVKRSTTEGRWGTA
ncbi:MAG: glycosyltransferase [Actinomycetota bacterium]|nr:glycosyltransferase [Actinomycetota bacterium]